MKRPLKGDYNPYFERYIDLVKGDDFSRLFSENTDDVINYFNGLPAEKHGYSYAPGKWTVKDILQHICDTERVMIFRALVAARNDKEAHLGNMDEDEYAKNAGTAIRRMKEITDEFHHLRLSSLRFFEGLAEEEYKRTAIINGYSFTPQAAGYIIIGHSIHHLNTLKERYI